MFFRRHRKPTSGYVADLEDDYEALRIEVELLRDRVEQLEFEKQSQAWHPMHYPMRATQTGGLN
jgi:hypothetical protein